MILKPQTWRRPPTLATTMTWVAGIFSALAGTQLVLLHESASTPPLLIVTCTVTALSWIWRMHLAREAAELRSDEQVIQKLQAVHRADIERQREEEAFREISRYLDDLEDH